MHASPVNFRAPPVRQTATCVAQECDSRIPRAAAVSAAPLVNTSRVGASLRATAAWLVNTRAPPVRQSAPSAAQECDSRIPRRPRAAAVSAAQRANTLWLALPVAPRALWGDMALAAVLRINALDRAHLADTVERSGKHQTSAPVRAQVESTLLQAPPRAQTATPARPLLLAASAAHLASLGDSRAWALPPVRTAVPASFTAAPEPAAPRCARTAPAGATLLPALVAAQRVPPVRRRALAQ